MKNIIYTYTAIILFFIGCSDYQNINSPEFSEASVKVNADPVNNLIEEEAEILWDMEPQWLHYPAPEFGTVLSPFYTTSSWIYSDAPGFLHIVQTYADTLYNEVKIIAHMKFDSSAIQTDSLHVSMSICTQTATLEFAPHTEFNIPAKLNMRIEGFDFSCVDSSDIDFVYANDNGTIEPIEYKDLIIKVDAGTIQLKDAKIPHFSRFGFIKRTADF
jgi:hypothetical protein